MAINLKNRLKKLEQQLRAKSGSLLPKIFIVDGVGGDNSAVEAEIAAYDAEKKPYRTITIIDAKPPKDF